MSNEWGQSRSNWKTASPLGKKTENFIWENADFAIYLRVRADDPCQEHWDFFSKNQTSERLLGPPCPKCWGTGRKVIPVITPIRTLMGRVSGTNDIRVRPGYTENWNIGGYVPRSLKPELQDFILYVEWNVPLHTVPTDIRRKVVRIIDVAQIDGIITPSERELSYSGLSLKAYNFEENLMSKNLIFTPRIPFLEKETWHQTSYWSG
jgi:hypothetical protein